VPGWSPHCPHAPSSKRSLYRAGRGL
jgi:hypothetical protein